MVQLIFLGTGGGRFATIYQTRATGGLYLTGIDSSASTTQASERPRGLNIHIDPGPGTLVQMKKEGLDPTQMHALLISHCHPDHYADAEMLVEAMTLGCASKSGCVVGSRSVVHGCDGIGPALSSYHQGRLGAVHALSPGEKTTLKSHAGETTIIATRTRHSDPYAVGFRLDTGHGDLSYTSDTEVSDEVISAHEGVRVLVLAVTRPLNAGIKYHMSTEGALAMVAKIRPEIAFLTHFGLKVIEEEPRYQARWVWRKSGVRTIAATDGMRVRLADEVEVEPGRAECNWSGI